VRFRRTHEATAGATVEAEPSGRSTGTYRVAVAHTDPEHPSAAVSHWGPAYNAAYAEMVSHILQVPVESVDLLEEAAKGAARARDDYSGMHGWEVWVETLNDDGTWERVA
jgi:glycine cleavage system aminomethyltransferase T